MTTITGKDAPLEESLSNFKALAAKLKLKLRETEWMNPLPNLYSLRLEEESCPSLCTNGKGSSKLAAQVSAYGEFFERLLSYNLFNQYFLGAEAAQADFLFYPDEKWFALPEESEQGELEPLLPSGLLNNALRKFYGQDGLKLENLVDLQSSSYQKGVCAIPFMSARNRERVYFPVNLLDNLYASNGMSAGNSQSEALVQALSEILERYVKKEVISKGLSLPQIPDKILQHYPATYETYRALQGDSLKVQIYDASLGGRFPVVCAVLFNQSTGGALASFGAHPILEVALERTLTELMQGRTFSDLDNLQRPSVEPELYADVTNLIGHFIDSDGLLPMKMFSDVKDFKFVHWDFSGPTVNQYQALRLMIDKAGFDIYIRCLQFDKVHVVRAVVPGMSEIYPVDDLIYNNNNRCIDLQEALLGLPGSNEDQKTYDAYRTELEDADLDDEDLVCHALGIMPDEGTAWETLRFGELKALLSLSASAAEPALEYANWTLSFNESQFALSRLSFYRCVKDLLLCRTRKVLNFEVLKSALAQVYGDEIFNLALAHVEGRQWFYDLKESDLNLSLFKSHRNMLEIYKQTRDFLCSQEQ